MINIIPIDFSWPLTNNSAPIQIQHGDYLIEDIENYIINDQSVGVQVYIYSDPQFQQNLEKQYSLSQYQLQQDCNLYVCINPQQIANIIIVTTQIDDGAEYEIQVQSDSAIYEIINSLQEQSVIQQEIVYLQLLDPNGVLLATDQQMQFLNFPQFQRFNLNLYTQIKNQVPERIGMKSNQQQKPKTIEKTDQAKELLKQLIVFPKLSILIDLDGEFVVYKYHFPIAINGFLRKNKAQKLNLNEQNYDFKSLNKIKYAQTDDYGLIISWGNSLYSKIRVKQTG